MRAVVDDDSARQVPPKDGQVLDVVAVDEHTMFTEEAVPDETLARVQEVLEINLS